MPDSLPLINGRTYSWTDIVCNILGVPIAGITAIKYESEREKEDVYGAGSEPVARGYGQRKYSASITLLTEEVVAIESVAPNGRIEDVPPFRITVAYLNVSNVMTIDILENCEFTKNSRDTKKGDKEIPVELPLIVCPIKFNVI